jgi:hypothetical protein
MNNFERLQKMSDQMVQSIWDAIWELNTFQRAELGDEWQEDVYSEICIRGLRSERPPVEKSRT